MAWWIVAAVALILHGTAPGPLQLPPAVQLSDAAPAVSADMRDAQRGTLPRVQTRATAVDAGLPKSPPRRFSSDKPTALPPAVPAIATAPAAAIVPNVPRTARPRIAVRFFDPRGPPIAA